MEILVCVKQVPDTETKITLRDGALNEDGVNYILNPYCEFALEEGLRIKEAVGGSVTVVSLGPARSQEAIRSAFAVGADQAVHVESALTDPMAVAAALADVIKGRSFDLILCGAQAIDDAASAVGPALAELLDLPQATVVTKLEVGEGQAKVHREAEGGTEVLSLPLPALITAQKGLNEPRYASFAGIRKAKSKPIEAAAAADVAVRVEQVELFLPAPRSAGEPLTGDAAAAVKALVKQLQEEAKVL